MPRKKADPIDRLKFICAAGKEPKSSEPIRELLKEYPEEELAQKIVNHNLNICKPHLESVSPIIPENNQLKDLNKSRFLEFKDQFYEKLYCRKVPLSKATPTNSKPDHVTNESVIFGKANERSESAYDLVLPNRNPKEVLNEFIKWHEKYKLSHGNYFPSERINRGYNEQFNSDQVFGEIRNADVSGRQVRNILQESSDSSKVCIVSNLQEAHINQHKTPIGKPMRRQGSNLNPETIFGQTSYCDDNVRQLLTSSVSPEESSKYSKETTYGLFTKDLQHSLLDCKSLADKNKSPFPRKGDCKFFAENLGEETTVKQLISPTIPLHFGLSHRDFFVPRSKDQIRRIFSNAGYDLNNDKHFEEVWSLALSQWTSVGELVSVEAFKYALDNIENQSG